MPCTKGFSLGNSRIPRQWQPTRTGPPKGGRGSTQTGRGLTCHQSSHDPSFRSWVSSRDRQEPALSSRGPSGEGARGALFFPSFLFLFFLLEFFASRVIPPGRSIFFFSTLITVNRAKPHRSRLQPRLGSFVSYGVITCTYRTKYLCCTAFGTLPRRPRRAASCPWSRSTPWPGCALFRSCFWVALSSALESLACSYDFTENNNEFATRNVNKRSGGIYFCVVSQPQRQFSQLFVWAVHCLAKGTVHHWTRWTHWTRCVSSRCTTSAIRHSHKDSHIPSL